MSSIIPTLVLSFVATYVIAYNTPFTPVSYIDYTQFAPQYLSLLSHLVNPQVTHPKCYNNMNKKWSNCHAAKPINVKAPNEGFVYESHLRPRSPVFKQFTNADILNTLTAGPQIIQNGFRRSISAQKSDSLNLLPIHVNIPAKHSESSQYSVTHGKSVVNKVISPIDNNYPRNPDTTPKEIPTTETNVGETKANAIFPILQKTVTSMEKIYNDFIRGLDQLERKFYAITFEKLKIISPANRKENGISFVQSGLFLLLSLIALSTEVDTYSKHEIEKCINIPLTEPDKLSAVSNEILSSLPHSSNSLKFRWSTRLILWPNNTISDEFKTGPAAGLQMHIDLFNGTDNSEQLAEFLNHLVEIDSGGSIRNTFEEDDLSEGAEAILLTTLYLRGRWRSAPTLLNGSRPFKDTEDSPTRSLRCIRINDVMRYADLTEWDAEAIEIFYATPGLSLMILVPRNSSLRRLADHVAATSIHYITQRMHSIRIGVTMPLYTLRMTLLLPNKLQAMGITRLVDRNNTMPSSLTLSHAVQRLMFWAEAGRNAFKDDGIEWDETPELELVVDRPYIFFVRWQNLTLMNGNFVL